MSRCHTPDTHEYLFIWIWHCLALMRLLALEVPARTVLLTWWHQLTWIIRCKYFDVIRFILQKKREIHFYKIQFLVRLDSMMSRKSKVSTVPELTVVLLVPMAEMMPIPTMSRSPSASVLPWLWPMVMWVVPLLFCQVHLDCHAVAWNLSKLFKFISMTTSPSFNSL